MTEYFSSREFKNLDAYAIATQPSGEYCSSDAPNPDVEASVTIHVSRCWSKYLFCVISETSFLMFSNDLLCSGFQLIGLCFSVFFNGGLNAAAVCAKFGIHLVRWCIEPMKLLGCLKVFGRESFSIAWLFLFKGVVSSLFIVYPSHSVCLQANLHFFNDMA